jgi:CSLREA domain-containing protein
MLRTPARITLALVLALLFAVALTASPAWAASFEVDSTADTNTGACTPAASDCTLRGALTAANNSTGTDAINFNIPGSGVKTIAPTSALPAITDPVTINGYTQGDGTADDATPNTLTVGNNAHLLIVLDGTGVSAGSASGGLFLFDSGSSDSTVLAPCAGS